MEANSKMLRPARGRLSPWIEALIQSHGVQEGEGEGQGEVVGRRLRAQVIGVGHLSASQAPPSDGPTGLLHLSDGAVQIPAVLTAAAWERLQEQEDRESFVSLLNTTVCVHASRLLFHAAPEQTRCRFFLSVDELATAAAGPVRESTPCCTTLPAVRAAICRAWRARLGRDEPPCSQSGFELSELLGEWRHDCLQEVMDDVRRRLAAGGRPVSPQPSTSARSTPPPPRTGHATGWDLDRVRYKGEERFNVPVRFLLIPEAEPPGSKVTESPGSKVTEPPGSKVTEPREVQPSVDDVDWKLAAPPAAGRLCETSDLPAEVGTPPEHTVADADLIDRVPSSNPWDQFPPPSVVSDSSTDPPTPTDAVVESNPDPGAAAQDATQASAQTAGSKGSGCLPPYQKQPSSSSSSSSSTSSSRKRKHSEESPEALSPLQEEEEEEVRGSPPSWLFASPAGGSGLESDGSPAQAAGRKTPSMHGDGSPYSYSYRPTGQNLQDFSRLRVSGPTLQWAVKYLIAPNRTEAVRQAGGSH